MSAAERLSDALKAQAARDTGSSPCTCSERSRAGKVVPCMTCRVKNFKAANPGGDDDEKGWYPL